MRQIGYGLMIAAVLFPAAAGAQQKDTAAAREHFRQGQAAYQRGELQKAVTEWKAAYAVDPKPLIKFNLSQAYERLGKLQQAAEALDAYLAAAPEDDPYRSDAEARRTAIASRISKTGIQVQGAPEGAAIYVDGEPQGTTPVQGPLAVGPGEHRIRVQMDGYQDFRAAVVVPAGETVAVNAELEPAAEAMAPVPSSVETGEGTNIWPFVVMGVGGALAITGGVFGVTALSTADDAATSESSQADSARTQAVLADVFVITGLAAVAGGLTWHLLESGDDEEAPSAQVRVTPVLGPGIAGAQGQVKF